MEVVREICKGVLIGVANVVPGVSGGTLAVAMGIYDQIIRAVTHMFKDFKNSVRTLLPYAIGAILGVAGLSFLIEYLFQTFPLQTSMAFVGLIAGGLPAMREKVSGEKAGVGGMTALSAAFLLIVLLTVAGGERGTALPGAAAIPFGALLAAGVIAAATMVVPGVSGSMILMMMGYYEPLLHMINQTVRAAAGFRLAEAWAYGLTLLPFAVGVGAGIFFCAKLVEYLLTRYEKVTYYGIIGLVLSSPVAILWGMDWAAAETHQILIGISLALAAYVLAALLGEEPAKR